MNGPLKTGLALDRCFEEHRVRPGHPERSERIASVHAALRKSGLAELCEPIAPERCDERLILMNHTEEYVDRARRTCESGSEMLDCPDTSVCSQTFEVALQATGTAVKAVRAVMRGELANAFCVIRPPGHHAEADESMGFCLFNSIAIAARVALAEFGISRVLIFDWDVHHGNGTQHSFEDDPRVFFCSMHGHPATLYPHTGFAEERGRGAGEGFTLNIPMPPSSGDPEYRRAFEEAALPAMEAFQPELVLISAGFDAHKTDPVGNQSLETGSFRWLTRELLGVADRHAGGKLVSMLEGGYNLEALGACAAVHLETLLGGA